MVYGSDNNIEYFDVCTDFKMFTIKSKYLSIFSAHRADGLCSESFTFFSESERNWTGYPSPIRDEHPVPIQYAGDYSPRSTFAAS
jgi:hypothetical protein